MTGGRFLELFHQQPATVTCENLIPLVRIALRWCERRYVAAVFSMPHVACGMWFSKLSLSSQKRCEAVGSLSPRIRIQLSGCRALKPFRLPMDGSVLGRQSLQRIPWAGIGIDLQAFFPMSKPDTKFAHDSQRILRSTLYVDHSTRTVVLDRCQTSRRCFAQNERHFAQTCGTV